MSKVSAPVNPISGKPNRDGCYYLTVVDAEKVLFFLQNKTYVACIGHRKSEKGVEYFYPYVKDEYSGKNLMLQKVYPEALVQDQDYNGVDIFQSRPLTRTGEKNQATWVSIYTFFMEEMARIKAPQLVGKTVKHYIHEGTEKVKLGPKMDVSEALAKNGSPVEDQFWCAGLTSVYCMETEKGEIAMGVVLYLGIPYFKTRDAFLKAHPEHKARNKRARVDEEIKACLEEEIKDAEAEEAGKMEVQEEGK